MKIKGIDISRAQEAFDFDKAMADGVAFVIIRAGIGEDEDTYLKANISGCKKRGLPYGFYWYVTAVSEAELMRQINACKKALTGEKPSYPVFFDMEGEEQIRLLTARQRTDMAISFCEEIKKYGLPCGVYANPSWLENYYEKDRITGKYDIWLAHWTENPDYPSKYDYGQTMWQWGIDNIGGKEVDGDICFVDYPAITAGWYKNKTEDSGKKPDGEQGEEYGFIAGDRVKVKKNAKFSDGTKPFDFVYDTVYSVIKLSGDGKEALIGLGDELTGWMFVKDIEKVENTAEVSFVKGDRVRVAKGAKTYYGQNLAPFVYDGIYEVMQAGLGEIKDYIVIGQSGQVTAAVKAKDLIRA